MVTLQLIWSEPLAGKSVHALHQSRRFGKYALTTQVVFLALIVEINPSMESADTAQLLLFYWAFFPSSPSWEGFCWAGMFFFSSTMRHIHTAGPGFYTWELHYCRPRWAKQGLGWISDNTLADEIRYILEIMKDELALFSLTGEKLTYGGDIVMLLLFIDGPLLGLPLLCSQALFKPSELHFKSQSSD